jgi:hypothetical protein
MWKNIIERDRPQITMRIVCWIPKTTNAHSEFVILIAFPLQEWLRERASMLRYSTFTSCLYWLTVQNVTSLKISCYILLAAAF